MRETAGGGDQEVLQDRGGQGVRDQDQDLHQDHRIRGYGLQGDRAQEARQVLNKGRHMKLDLIRIISSKKPECIMQDGDR